MNVFVKAVSKAYVAFDTAFTLIDDKMEKDKFSYEVEQFADLQILRYQVPGFDSLSLRQKSLIYYLSEAALYGRDILFDQNGKYNLVIRKMLEAVYVHYSGDRTSAEFKKMEVYLKRVWFSSGIYHHYSCDKFVPEFSPEFFKEALCSIDRLLLPLHEGQTVDELCEMVFPVIFDSSLMPKRVNQTDGADLIQTSAANYYEGVSQQEAECFYEKQKKQSDDFPVMFGMNSKLVKENGTLKEKVWKLGGMYSAAIERIVYWLKKARMVAENKTQEKVIDLLVEFYRTGDLKTFDDYSIAWLKDTESLVDFVNGFIESYGDPLGLKSSWEAIVNFKDLDATQRTEIVSSNAQWFEDHSPVDARFKKEKVKGVSAKVITAAILAGDLYPSTAIGINLPNSNWIRSIHGSKSVTIGNITDAYNQAAKGNGFRDEFVYGEEEKNLLTKYADRTDSLHTDLHECLGHGSGKLLPGVDPDALKAYGSTIEEARADLFGLYYLPDNKMIELGLLPDKEAYKAEYYSYMMNGLMTQLVRIEPGGAVEEAHMRNRQLIARWALEYGAPENVAELTVRNGKTFVVIHNYEKLRELFGKLLGEVQRIKSEGDYNAARNLVESYGVKIDKVLHEEVLKRYASLHLAPYKGFLNPRYIPVTNNQGKLIDVRMGEQEGYAEQMLRYSCNYATL